MFIFVSQCISPANHKEQNKQRNFYYPPPINTVNSSCESIRYVGIYWQWCCWWCIPDAVEVIRYAIEYSMKTIYLHSLIQAIIEVAH